MTPHQFFEHDDRGQPWPAQVQAAAFGGLADACQAALAVRALRVARGEQPRGFKVGFTNRTLWERYKVCAPIWGTVWDTTLTFCNGSGELDLACTCQPGMEPEPVFGIKARPKDNADLDDLDDIHAAVGWVATGFEIVQSHRRAGSSGRQKRSRMRACTPACWSGRACRWMRSQAARRNCPPCWRVWTSPCKRSAPRSTKAWAAMCSTAH